MIENGLKPLENNNKPDADVVIDLNRQIALILGESSLQAIELVLTSHFNKEVIADFEIIEKINLFLVIAAKEKASIPLKLQQALKKINEILPDEKLNLSYLQSLGEQKRKRIFQIVSSLVLLITFSLSTAKSAVDLNHEQNRVIAAEVSSDLLNERKQKEIEARAKFERLFSEDLATVVAEMGWEAFLAEYTYIYDQGIWSPEEVFQLLVIQQPRYWGYYIVNYPEAFVETVKKSSFTLSDFMSSSGSEEFFRNLRNHEMQGWHKASWLDVYSTTELLETLKIINPDWARVVVENQEFFAGQLTKDDLPALARFLYENESPMSYFLREYSDNWEQSWSKRELLNALKTESLSRKSISWRIFVANNSDFFASELSKEEVKEIVEAASFFSNNGTAYPSEAFSKFFDNYYAYKLYLVISPQEFIQAIEHHFSQDIVVQILNERPELTDLENRSMEELFSTGAITYVLDNYPDWQQTHTINEIMDFLRQNQQGDYYKLIAPYPKLFREVAFSDEEVTLLAYVSSYKPTRSEMPFFINFAGENGWQQQISMERLLLIGRTDNQYNMSIAAIQFPELFFPYFNEEDIYNLIISGSSDLERLDVLKSDDPIWERVATIEQRRKFLDLIKQREARWDEVVMMKGYLFEEILTFGEMQEIMSRGYQSELRRTEVWLENTSPEWEYHFFKGLDERIFASVMVNNFATFDKFMTEEDRLLVLKYYPDQILLEYRLWKSGLPVELILDNWQQEKEEENNSYLVVPYKHIFGWAFYEQYDLRDFIKQGGATSRLFDVNNDTNHYYYEEWLEFMSIEELFFTLRSFEEGRVLILAHPDLFLEFVEISDLDLFMEPGYDALYRLISNEEWQDLWQLQDIYESAKKHNVEYLAETIFYGDYKDLFMPLVQQDDLRILVRSYPYNYDAGYSFSQDMPSFLERWTAEEIFIAVQEEHPGTWGDFVAQKDAPYFNELIDRSDLSDLIVNGAQPDGLMSFGLWGTDELFTAYQQHNPESWGSIIVSNAEIFKDEVIKRNISLRDILENGGAEEMYYNIWLWDSIWSEKEIIAILDEMGIEPPEASG